MTANWYRKAIPEGERLETFRKNFSAGVFGRGHTKAVLVHGWGDNSSTWDLLTPILAQHYQCHQINLPSHIHGPENVSELDHYDLVTTSSNLLARYLEEENFTNQDIVIAHSMGAMIFLEAQLIRATESVPQNAIFISPLPCNLSKPTIEAAIAFYLPVSILEALKPTFIGKLIFRKALESVFKNPRALSAAFKQQATEHFLKPGSLYFAKAYSSALRSRFIEYKKQNGANRPIFKGEITLLYGSQDDTPIPNYRDFWKDNYSVKRVGTIENSGHFVHRDQPEWTAKKILAAERSP